MISSIVPPDHCSGLIQIDGIGPFFGDVSLYFWQKLVYHVTYRRCKLYEQV